MPADSFLASRPYEVFGQQLGVVDRIEITSRSAHLLRFGEEMLQRLAMIRAEHEDHCNESRALGRQFSCPAESGVKHCRHVPTYTNTVRKADRQTDIIKYVYLTPRRACSGLQRDSQLQKAGLVLEFFN